ncbi:MAG: hypothetical protein AAGM38_11275 [Pseudomonadota bacterium]
MARRERHQPIARRAARFGAALLLLASAPSAALPQSAPGGRESFAAFTAELNDPGAQFVVVSSHFRHQVSCASQGCVLMGPTEDQDACEEWASHYNRIDPFDHARCVVSTEYDAIRYR